MSISGVSFPDSASSSAQTSSGQMNISGHAADSVRTTAQSLDAYVLDSELSRQIQQLKTIEQNIRVHEQAHKAVGGRYAGAVSCGYFHGPDDRIYIAGGEISIDVSPENDPEATIRKTQQVTCAAMAPTCLSPQNRAVAAQANATAFQYRAELYRRNAEEQANDATLKLRVEKKLTRI